MNEQYYIYNNELRPELEEAYNKVILFHSCHDRRIKIGRNAIYPNMGSVFYVLKGTYTEIEQGISYTAIYIHPDFKTSFLIFIGEFVKFNEIFKSKMQVNSIEEWVEMPIRTHLSIQIGYSEIKMLNLSLEKLKGTKKNTDRAYSFLIFLECYTILYNFFVKRIIEKTKEVPLIISTDIVLRVEKYIDENLDKKITLGDIAREFGENSKSINTMFKRVKKETINKYIISKRVEVAREMLLEGREDIETISKKVGIQDITYFYRIFKKITGMTPRRYRIENCIESLSG